MADNYLERKMESLRGGKTVIRKAGPSLDTLLRRISECDGCRSGNQAGSPVKQVQMEAALRSGEYTSHRFEYTVSEREQQAAVTMPGHDEADLIRLGEVLLAIRLKSAELGIRTEVKSGPGACAIIRFSK